MSDTTRVLITGASSGFGRMITEGLAERGATVFATMRGVEGKNAETAASIRDWAEEGGREVHVLELDVTDDASVEGAVRRAIGLGGIDVVVNNAGVGSFGVGESYTSDRMAALFDVNVFGVHRVNRAVLPHLREKGRGLVVYLSSALGRVVLPFMGPYNATKHAIEGLAETMDLELRPLGIETVIVEPGGYDTSFGANMWPGDDDARVGSYGPVADGLEAFGEMFESRAETGEFGDPSEVATAVVELVYAPAGERPLRLPLGEDMTSSLTAVNRTRAEVHARLYEELGLDRLLGSARAAGPA